MDSINNNNNGGGGGETRLVIGVTVKNFHCIRCVNKSGLCSKTLHSSISLMTRDECDTKRKNYKDDKSILKVNVADKFPISELHSATATAPAPVTVTAPVPTPATAQATATVTAPSTAPSTATATTAAAAATANLCEREIEQTCEEAAMQISRTFDKDQLRTAEATRALSYDHNLSWELNQSKNLDPMVNTPIYRKNTRRGKRRRTGIV
jgi:hypothetical protein